MKIIQTNAFREWLGELSHAEKQKALRKQELVGKTPYTSGERISLTQHIRHIRETDLYAIPTGDIGHGGKGHWVVFSPREDEAIFIGGLDDIGDKKRIARLEAELESYKQQHPHRSSHAVRSIPETVSAGAGLAERFAARAREWQR